MSNLNEYKTTTLARADVDDIVMIEPVEKRKAADGSIEKVVWKTENNRTLTKYDVHLMREVDGVKTFQTEQIALLDEGTATEEVVFREKGSTEPKDVTESQIENYVKNHANNAAYQDKQITKVDTKAPSVYFTGVVDNGDGTGTKKEFFAYMKNGTPTTLELGNVT